MLKKTLCLFLSFMLFFLCLNVDSKTYASSTEPKVHVKLLNYLGNKSVLTIKAMGTYSTEDGKEILTKDTSYLIKLEGTKLNVYSDNQLIYSSSTLKLTPSDIDNHYLLIDGRAYKGSFQFIIEAISGTNYIRPINTVGMEDYVKGVVPNEMYASWSLEALKAQAVAARTYSWQLENKTIDDTTRYQVYGGYMIGTSYTNSNKAVEQTTGQVLKYNGKLIDAVFSASNGGILESSKNAWGNEYAYLQPKLDSYDTNYLWNLTVQKTQIDLQNKDLADPNSWWSKTNEADSVVSSSIKSWLNNNGYKDKEIKIISIPTLEFLNPSTTVRVTNGSLIIQFFVKDLMKDGKLALQTLTKSNISYTQMRAILGSTQVKTSVIVNSLTNATTHSISGRGFGHGVGLSQYGANNRAKDGQNYETILAFYYPNTDLITEYTKVNISTPTAIPTALIKDLKTTFSNKTDTFDIAFTLNATANTLVRVKDNNNNIITTVLTNTTLNSGNYVYKVDVSNWNNGNYTTEILTIDGQNKQSTASTVVEVNKIAATSIRSISAIFNTTTKIVDTTFHLDQSANTTVQIKDSNNNIVTALASNTALPAGTTSYSWDASKLNNGTYTVEIASINNVGKLSTATSAFLVNQPTIPTQTIKDVKTAYDTSKNTIKVSFHINQTTNTTVKILDSKNKTVKTLVTNKSVKAGTQSYTWNVGSAKDGNYKVLVESVNTNKEKKSGTKNFSIYKVKTGTVSASLLNIRQSPSSSSKKVGTIKKNQKVTIYAKSNSWYKIKSGKVTGYVSSSYIKNVK